MCDDEKRREYVPVPTSESLTRASIPRSFINLQVSLAAGMYAFPYNATRQLPVASFYCDIYDVEETYKSRCKRIC